MGLKRLQVTYNPTEERNKKVHLRKKYTVLDDHHAEIGYVKGRVLYTLVGEEYGKFFKDKDSEEIVLRRLDPKAKDKSDESYTKVIGYLRDNDQIYAPNGRRVLILEKKSYLVPIVLFIVILSLLASILSFRQIMTSKDYIPTLFITEVGGQPWSDTEELTIFKNGQYGDSIIYPGITGEYSFRLENRNPDALIYSIYFSEVNEHEVNMLYRIKKNGEYLNDESFKPIAYIFFENLTVNASCNDTFTLEWKWEGSENDTDIGMSNATYVLKIRVDAHI